jgi:hypothetical protein
MSDDKPPLFRSWKTWYKLVLLVMLIQVVIYYLITSSFS